MSPFLFKYIPLLCIFIIVIRRIITISALEHQVKRNKQISEHVHTPNIDLLTQKESRTPIEWLERNVNINQIKKKEEEQLKSDTSNKPKNSNDHYSDDTNKEKQGPLDINGKKKQFIEIENKDDEVKDYCIKLHAQNLRWSIPMYIGSEQKPLQLVISTSSPYTALHCTYEASEDGDPLKYDISSSTDIAFYPCSDNQCTAAHGTEECLSLEKHLEKLKQFTKKKRTCTNKFCDYVKPATFLNMAGPFDDKSANVCGFSGKIGQDEFKGFFFRDSFFIKNKFKSSYNNFVCLTSEDKLMLNDKHSGVLGLGYYDEEKNSTVPSILDPLIVHSISKKPIFGICINKNHGFITFGGYNPNGLESFTLDDVFSATYGSESHKVTWIYYDENKPKFALHVEYVSLLNKYTTLAKHDMNEEMYVDLYEYFLLLPEEFTKQLKDKIKEECTSQKGHDCEKILTEGKFKQTNRMDKYPTIEIMFRGGRTIIEPKEYLIEMEDNYVRIMVESSNTHVLGVPFFLNNYVLFNKGQKKIGISKSGCGIGCSDTNYSGIDYEFGKEPELTLMESIKEFSKNNKRLLIGVGLAFCALIILICFVRCAR